MHMCVCGGGEREGRAQELRENLVASTHPILPIS